ncbi:MAG TPA: 4-alpha-glucanotransferase, partial [Azospirillaceae bacterium]|nr:4-alpha-glucanotransferase [Azospirillaceae bacterium]
PEAYPPLALATAGNHDMATLRGWWEGRDIGLKQKHGLYPMEGEAARQLARRSRERAALADVLERAGLAPKGLAADSPYGDELSLAGHAFLAASRASIAMVQLDDLTDEADQVNLPATTDAYPNWRRKLSLSIEDILNDRRVRALAEVMNRVRPFGRQDSTRREE